uniref:RicAFT regulatory complex protein RicA family protein n=2 Tax=Paenibacillus sp. IHBB 10380 TaxID=1566358 RepID=UPI0005CFBEA4|nr:YlbF family regulator [Paenibacillus sp. IHBB 10380]
MGVIILSQEQGHINKYGMMSYDSRDLVIQEDIMAKAKELADLISGSEEVRQFQQAEEKIRNHQRVQDLIVVMKKKQKEIVAFESFENKEMVAKIEGEIAEYQDEIDGIPIVVEFQQSQTDINYLLQLVISVIRDTVSEKVNVEVGTDSPPTHCG